MAEKPAIFQYERKDEYKAADRYTPAMVTIKVELYIYTAPGTDSSVMPYPS